MLSLTHVARNDFVVLKEKPADYSTGFSDTIPVIHALFSEVNPIPVKAAMNMLGYNVGSLRMPLTEMEDENKAILRQAMIDAGIKVVK